MPIVGEGVVRHTAVVAAPANEVFDLLAELREWSQFHRPSVHAQSLGVRDGAESFRHWWVLDEHTVRTWQASWRFDREALRIEYEWEPAEPPAAGSRGVWTFRPLSASSTEVTVDQAALGEGGFDAERVDRESGEFFAGLVEAAEQTPEQRDLAVDFEDPLFVAGSIDDAYAYLYEADKWPERIPHVSRLVLEERVANIQFFDMDTETPDGSAHTTRSVRVCLPGELIVYKQIHLPKLLTGHTGHWRFTPTREGFVLAARHTATIDPSALSILGPGTSVLDARKYLRRVLSANSMSNLRLAKAFAEERAGV
ncbi:SRPBCC family protein [Embleya sp. NPDC056575]|uniref:SRPBCC family protein n=1 Tax=unclassified Embleya TaxID=2699296 RepID=UPI0036D1E263